MIINLKSMRKMILFFSMQKMAMSKIKILMKTVMRKELHLSKK